jgi:hypothetical protein
VDKSTVRRISYPLTFIAALQVGVAPAHAQDASAEYFDRFGHGFARGDFNGDDIDDLAIGAPTESLNSANGPISYAGAANVIYSSNDYYIGLTAEWPSRPDQFFSPHMILPPLPWPYTLHFVLRPRRSA